MASYSFEDVQATMTGPGGSISLGSGSGNSKEGISFEFLEDKSSLLMGSDGNGVHSLRASKAARVSVRLLKTSPVNSQLQTMYNTQIQSSALWGRNVVNVGNVVTGDDAACTEVAFQKVPRIDWQEDANFNEWQLLAIKADLILGTGI